MDKKDLKGIDTLLITARWTLVNGFEECEIGVVRGDEFVTNDTLEAVEEYLIPIFKKQLDQAMEAMDAILIPGVCHCRKEPEYIVTTVEVEEETS